MNPRPRLANRAEVVNPCARISFWERCVQAGAVDLEGNYREVVVPGGFVDVVPIDDRKLCTRQALRRGRRRHEPLP